MVKLLPVVTWENILLNGTTLSDPFRLLRCVGDNARGVADLASYYLYWHLQRNKKKPRATNG